MIDMWKSLQRITFSVWRSNILRSDVKPSSWSFGPICGCTGRLNVNALIILVPWWRFIVLYCWWWPHISVKLFCWCLFKENTKYGIYWGEKKFWVGGTEYFIWCFSSPTIMSSSPCPVLPQAVSHWSQEAVALPWWWLNYVNWTKFFISLGGVKKRALEQNV